jgi:hypothetical protein
VKYDLNLDDAPEELIKILKALYRDPMSIVIIRGLPKTGKTDFAGLIAELCKKLGIIKFFASNTDFNCPWIAKIQALNTLQAWGESNRGSKLYIYDELIQSATNRRAMKDLNVALVQFLPQISKYGMHLIVIVQEDQSGKRYYESVFRDPVYLRGVWTKVTKTFATFRSQYLKQTGDMRTDDYSLNSVPRTSIKFDKDRIATFVLNESPSMTDFSKMPRTLKVAMIYATEKGGFGSIEKETGLNRKQIQREIKKICRLFLSTDKATMKEVQDDDATDLTSNTVKLGELPTSPQESETLEA